MVKTGRPWLSNQSKYHFTTGHVAVELKVFYVSPVKEPQAYHSIFDDRMEFVSIGGLPKGVSLEDILLGLSVLRNENLANVFYRLHLIEAYGTGIPKIIRSYADCMRKPELQATGNAFKITLPNRNVLYHKKVSRKVDFTENEEKILSLLNKQEEVTRKDVETKLVISQAMAVRLLRKLIDKGAVRVIGGGKNTRYRISPKP